MLDPVPTSVPPHDPLYHFQEAPVPNDPTDTLNVTEVPEATLIDEAFAADAATLFLLMVRFKYCVLQPFTKV
jgi:hypothetical protein